jgi:large subunit ribosomal protein L18
VIDDTVAKTVAGIDTKKAQGATPVEKAHTAGKDLGKDLLEKKIEKVVFDRGGFIYHGAIKAFAEGLREAGIQV